MRYHRDKYRQKFINNFSYWTIWKRQIWPDINVSCDWWLRKIADVYIFKWDMGKIRENGKKLCYESSMHLVLYYIISDCFWYSSESRCLFSDLILSFFIFQYRGQSSEKLGLLWCPFTKFNLAIQIPSQNSVLYKWSKESFLQEL